LDETFLTRPPDSFFKARDLYDTALYYGDLRLTLPEGAVFRYLLENVMYRPRDQARYGYVAEAALGTRMIAQVTCMGTTTTSTALRRLEARRMIRKYPAKGDGWQAGR
jgi:DNA-binding MarR family transcriptional regulator